MEVASVPTFNSIYNSNFFIGTTEMSLEKFYSTPLHPTSVVCCITGVRNPGVFCVNIVDRCHIIPKVFMSQLDALNPNTWCYEGELLDCNGGIQPC